MNRTVVVGCDQTQHSELALDEAAAEAVRRGASLAVVHACGQPPPAPPSRGEPAGENADHIAAQRIADQGAYRARSRHPGLEVHTQVEVGDAPAVLGALSHDAGLLVVEAEENAEPALEGLLKPWRDAYPDIHVRHAVSSVQDTEAATGGWATWVATRSACSSWTTTRSCAGD